MLERARSLPDGRSSAFSILCFAVLSLAGAAAVAFATGIPRPGVADEFCYLLAGDTFSRFRLSNPPHELWKHFEAFWILHQPTYSPKYPPAQGLFLAVGQWLGHPILGVWLSTAFMCAAITWMLRSWVGPRWALFGGLLVTFKFGISGDWAQSYMGGAVAAGGGALLYGGLKGILDTFRVRDALLLGLGLIILANSRPYEGLLISLPAAAVLLAWFIRRRGDRLRRAALVVGLPIVSILALGAVWTLAHNQAVTGNALRLPYQHHIESYPFIKAFVWQRVSWDNDYRHHIMRAFEREHRNMLMESNPPGIKWRAVKRRFELLRLAYLPGFLWIPLLALPFALGSRWTLLALGSCLFMLAGQLLTVPLMPYTSAPATGLLIVLIVMSVRSLPSFEIKGVPSASVVAVLVGSIFFVNCIAQARDDNSAHWGAIQRARPRIEADLPPAGGGHVIFVSYGAFHNDWQEWVYNSAEIDSQHVIWAQDRGDALNQEVIHYYPNRRFWRLELGFEHGNEVDAHPIEYRLRGNQIIGSDQLPEVVAWFERSRDPTTRGILLRSILSGSTAGARALRPSVWLFGTYSDRPWTRGTQPAFIAVANDSGIPVTPVLRLSILADDSEYPITVRIDDGRRLRERVFNARGVRNIQLRPMKPGKAVLLVVETDKAWQPRGRDQRPLGVGVLDVALEPVSPVASHERD